MAAMTSGHLDYPAMLQRALRGVVREALTVAAEHGLPGQHHFYLTFRTTTPGVDIPDYLAQRYPDEMTIVLQHKFWGLEIEDEKFAVTLTFKGRSERLVVPWEALTGFADPSVEFGLKLGTVEPTSAVPAPAAPSEKPVETPAAPITGAVVSLDSFRKK